jgi:hypothetical protein
MTEKYYGINKECEDYIDIICNFKTERNDMKSLANTEKFPKGVGVVLLNIVIGGYIKKPSIIS